MAVLAFLTLICLLSSRFPAISISHVAAVSRGRNAGRERRYRRHRLDNAKAAITLDRRHGIYIVLRRFDTDWEVYKISIFHGWHSIESRRTADALFTGLFAWFSFNGFFGKEYPLSCVCFLGSIISRRCGAVFSILRSRCQFTG